jgi:LmbE family N-acetylglucosaminyl deacetylase
MKVKGKRVMAIAAHPDDADFYCGGTVAKWIKEGAEVVYVICTDDSCGSDTGDISPRELADLRRKEQDGANKVYGVKETIYLGYPDMGLYDCEELRRDVAREIRKYKPHILLAFDPWLRYEVHPDHTASAKGALYGRFAAKLPLKFPELLKDEGLKPWGIDEAYFFKTDQPNLWVDIEDYLEMKVAALACHHSQFADLVPNQEQGMGMLKMLSHKEPETGRVAERFKFLPLEGLEGLKAYISL